MKTSLLLLATLTLAALPACSGEAQTIGMEEALEGIPESERLASFLGLAFENLRAEQLGRRSSEQFLLTPSERIPVPLLTESEAEELYALLDAAASGEGWNDYAVLTLGAEPRPESMARSGRYWLGDLAALLAAAPEPDWKRGAILVQVFRDRVEEGSMLAWIDAVKMADGLRRTPLLVNHLMDWTVPPEATAGFFESLAGRSRDEASRADFHELLQAAGDCVECRRNAVLADMTARKPDRVHNIESVDFILWRMSKFAAWEACESCAGSAQPEPIGPEDDWGLVEMRPANPGAAYPSGPEREACWLMNGEGYTLGPATWVQVGSAGRSEDRHGHAAVVVSVPAELTEPFEEFTGEHVDQQLAFIVDGRVLAVPEILDPLPGSFVLSGRMNGWSPLEMRMTLRALRRASLSTHGETVLGADAD